MKSHFAIQLSPCAIWQENGDSLSYGACFALSLTASLVPVFIGSALAYNTGGFSPDLAAAMLLASLLIQSAVNIFNEYYDFERRLDAKDTTSFRLFIPQPMNEGEVLGMEKNIV